jgi:hypothetical protein
VGAIAVRSACHSKVEYGRLGTASRWFGFVSHQRLALFNPLYTPLWRDHLQISLLTKKPSAELRVKQTYGSSDKSLKNSLWTDRRVASEDYRGPGRWLGIAKQEARDLPINLFNMKKPGQL